MADRTWQIYKAICLPTSKAYIGLTVGRVMQRWSNHVSDATARRRRSILHAAIRKYGREAFIVTVIATANDLASASEAERLAIMEHDTRAPAGYNMALGGMGTPGVRRPHSDSTKAKIAAGNTGKTFSAAARQKMAAAKRGKALSPAHRQKLSIVRTGKSRSPYWRAKIAAGHRGNKYPKRSVALLQLASAGGYPSTSGSRGVIAEGKKWTARLGMDGRRIHLGTFDTIEAAAAAYKEAVAKRIAALSEATPQKTDPSESANCSNP